jgi:hypothetical protein
MNILEEVLKYDGYVRTEGIDVSPSEITSKSNYQRWLGKTNRPTTYENPIANRVNSVIGTGLHEYASKVLKQHVDFKGYSELPIKGEIAGYKVGGTIDVVYDYEDTYIVGDFKTVGVYQLKKAMKNNYVDYLPQLSIYSYLYSQSIGVEYSRLGELYIIVTGDAGWFSKDDGGGRTPKYFTETIELLDKHEVEELVAERMLAIQDEPEVDCDTSWACGYCNFDCEYRQGDL